MIANFYKSRSLFVCAYIFFSSQLVASGMVSIAAIPIIFGKYQTFNSEDVYGTGEIELTCISQDDSADISVHCKGMVTISLSAGYSNDPYNRAMLSKSGHRLNYNLYRNSSHTIIWGNKTKGGKVKSKNYSIKKNAASTLTIYGKIFAQQMVPPGIYRDQITISLDF